MLENLIHRILNESPKDDAARAAQVIDDFTDKVHLDINNHKVCHSAVALVKSAGKDLYFLLQSGVRYSFYNNLTFVEWDESKWNDAVEEILKDLSYKKIPVKAFQNLIDDIADGTCNGHSYIKFKKSFYIDPYLSSASASFDNIQKCGKYLDKIFTKIGIKN